MTEISDTVGYHERVASDVQLRIPYGVWEGQEIGNMPLDALAAYRADNAVDLEKTYPALAGAIDRHLERMTAPPKETPPPVVESTPPVAPIAFEPTPLTPVVEKLAEKPIDESKKAKVK